MSVSQFSLKCDTFNENICNGFYRLQQREEFVDMTLAADGYFVKVHQNIIALASPYLKSLLRSAPCQHPVIFLNNINYETLSYILEYIYTGEVQVAADKIQLLMDGAMSLHIIGMKGAMLPKDNVNGTNTPDKYQNKPDTFQEKFNKFQHQPGGIQDGCNITETTPCITSNLNYTKETTANLNSDIALKSNGNTRSSTLNPNKTLNFISTTTTDLNPSTAVGLNAVTPTVYNTDTVNLTPTPTMDLKSIINASSLSLNPNKTLDLVSTTATDLNQSKALTFNSVTSTEYNTGTIDLAPKPLTNLNLYQKLALDPVPSTFNTILNPNLTPLARNAGPILILNPITSTDSFNPPTSFNLNSELVTNLRPSETICLNPNTSINSEPLRGSNVAASITINSTEADEYQLEVQNFNENNGDNYVPVISCNPTDEDTNNSSNKEVLSSTPQYTMSNRGSLQLILNGYMYYAHHGSDGGRKRRWRCVDYRRLHCPVFIDTNDEIIISRKNIHTHPRHDKKIFTTLRRKKMYTSIKRSLEAIKNENHDVTDKKMES